MNKWLQKLVSQMKELWGKISGVQKVIFFSIIGVSFLAIILLFSFSGSPSMVSLIGIPIDDEDELARIIYKLDEEIPGKYEVRADNTIYVSDETTARRIRTVLIREDLIPKEADPWELFDVERWTLTDFERDINLRRALTKNLEQHILSLDDVDAVDVMIDIPEESLLVEDEKPFTASIVITPKPGSELTKNKIEGLVKLVKFAISGLTDENIVITDHTGIVLNDFEGMEDIDRLELARREIQEKMRLEQQYKNEILTALQKFFTEDRIDIIKLSIDLDMSKETSNYKEYIPITVKEDDPGTPYSEEDVLVSTPLSFDKSETFWKGTGVNPQGPPGQEGQTPPQYSDMSDLQGEYQQTTDITNMAISEKNTEREERPWDIKTISVSVAIDGIWKWKYDEEGEVIILTDGSIEREYFPVTEDQLATVTKLVEAAIGYDQARGDQVVVQHLQIDRTSEHLSEDNKIRQEKQLSSIIFWILVGVGVILIAIVLFRMLSRYLERKRQEKEEELARQHQAMREAALRTAEEQGMDVELSIEERARMEMQENAINMAREHPEDVAQLIRTWLMEE